MVVLTSLDPRSATFDQIKASLFRLGIGIVLGFVIMLLYGLGMPGLRYFFMLIGIGGVAHIVAARKTGLRPTHTSTYTAPSSVNS